MAEQTQANVTDQNKRDLTYNAGVIEKIAALSVVEIPGILSMSTGAVEGLTERLGRKDLTKGVTAEVGEKQAAIDLNVVIKYGSDIPKVYDEAKRRITENIRHMTGLEVVEVQMHVDDIDSEGEGKLGYEKQEVQDTTNEKRVE
ncbi:Asp23/Gls24 family envelope stress response protein [Sinobaca sp. H24]|uniref:Asp23/Gls24 family envelope stress response protein n=1 Tax=Sinobaca sp. H24 TaxID=2923376 RepID=UPI002079E3BF|nr:Asp23/Gls24 family envelope stress response protein [Sinobaca sp. H24]